MTVNQNDGKQFADLVRQSKLVKEDNLNALLRSFRIRTAEADVGAAVIAEQLVHARLLTAWQAERLLRGDFENFFLGRYRLLSNLGEGAMGVVYLAEHIRMRRRAAIKILPQRFVEDARRLESFYRESEATAALDHPNVVRAYDADNEGDKYYLVMEYVDGSNFHEIVARNGPFFYADAAEYTRQAADGLGHAHERGIIHRDVKPANLMLDLTDRVKILDMGLSHWEEIELTPKVSTGKISGTPSFLAPELSVAGAQVDVCSDIYSLGCTFYFLLTGKPPFVSESIREVLLKHLREPPPLPVEIVPELPDELQAIYLRMMAKKPEDRYSSTKEICAALSDWQSKDDPTASTDRGARTHSGEIRTILIAEDDEVTQQMLIMQLKKAGFEVRAASDGQEAMDIMDGQITVCLFDLNMPRASGMDCLRFVHENYPMTPVIILTASEEIQDAIGAMREGAFDYLTKPCRINNVLNRVEDAIRSRKRRELEGASLNTLFDADGTAASSHIDTIILDQSEDESPLEP